MAGNRGVKLSNEYARSLVDYARVPKAVLAAVAYSLASRILEGEGRDSESPTIVEEFIIEEWRVLNQNGIVPQEPPK
jgi:hypothetical protein